VTEEGLPLRLGLGTDRQELGSPGASRARGPFDGIQQEQYLEIEIRVPPSGGQPVQPQPDRRSLSALGSSVASQSMRCQRVEPVDFLIAAAAPHVAMSGVQPVALAKHWLSSAS